MLTARFGDARREVTGDGDATFEGLVAGAEKEFLNKLMAREHLLDERKPCGMSAEYEALLRLIS